MVRGMVSVPKPSLVFNRADWSPSQRAFRDALDGETTLLQINGALMRQWQDKARLEVAVMPGDSVHLMSLAVYEPGRGHGGAAMKWLLNLCDRHQQAMTLSVTPTGRGRNPLKRAAALRAWYARRGFMVTDGRWMRRAPLAAAVVAPPCRPGGPV